jgi:hypothetical protein
MRPLAVAKNKKIAISKLPKSHFLENGAYDFFPSLSSAGTCPDTTFGDFKRNFTEPYSRKWGRGHVLPGFSSFYYHV